MCAISWRTNSPACVPALLPADLSSAARFNVLASGMSFSFAAEEKHFSDQRCQNGKQARRSTDKETKVLRADPRVLPCCQSDKAAEFVALASGSPSHRRIHMTKFFLTTLVLLAVLLAMKDARADDDSKWSLGAGIGMQIIDVDAASIAPQTIGGQLILERRLTHQLWLTLDPYAGVSASVQPMLVYLNSNQGTPVGNDSSYADAGLSVGLRYVINPGGIVEVSPLFNVALGYSYSGPQKDYEQTTTTDSASTSVGTSVGIALERQLLPNLYVRVATTLFAASYQWGSVHYNSVGGSAVDSYGNVVNTTAVNTRNSTASLHAGLSVSPSLSLRLAI
jgi:hypothetical protein